MRVYNLQKGQLMVFYFLGRRETIDCRVLTRVAQRRDNSSRDVGVPLNGRHDVIKISRT